MEGKGANLNVLCLDFKWLSEIPGPAKFLLSLLANATPVRFWASTSLYCSLGHRVKGIQMFTSANILRVAPQRIPIKTKKRNKRRVPYVKFLFVSFLTTCGHVLIIFKFSECVFKLIFLVLVLFNIVWKVSCLPRNFQILRNALHKWSDLSNKSVSSPLLPPKSTFKDPAKVWV